MQFFVDTADIGEIRSLVDTGLVDGVTTNPTLVAKTGRPIKTVIAEICEAVPGPVSAEVAATDYDGMLQEAAKLSAIAPNVVIKLPLTIEGLRACRELSNRDVRTNVTLCFSANQALLAAKAGATYISPFVGRLDDGGQDGVELIAEIRQLYDNYEEIDTQILAASLRTTISVKQVALIGADVATMPPSLIRALVKHPLTDKGLAAFLDDWQKSGQKID